MGTRVQSYLNQLSKIESELEELENEVKSAANTIRILTLFSEYQRIKDLMYEAEYLEEVAKYE